MLPSILLISVHAHFDNYSPTHNFYSKMLKNPSLKMVVFVFLCVYDLRLLVEEARAVVALNKLWWWDTVGAVASISWKFEE